jgi:hypothetical protein
VYSSRLRLGKEGGRAGGFKEAYAESSKNSSPSLVGARSIKINGDLAKTADSSRKKHESTSYDQQEFQAAG